MCSAEGLLTVGMLCPVRQSARDPGGIGLTVSWERMCQSLWQTHNSFKRICHALGVDAGAWPIREKEFCRRYLPMVRWLKKNYLKL